MDISSSCYAWRRELVYSAKSEFDIIILKLFIVQGKDNNGNSKSKVQMQ